MAYSGPETQRYAVINADSDAPMDLLIDDHGFIGCSAHQRPKVALFGASAPDDALMRTRIQALTRQQGWHVISWNPWKLQRSAALFHDVRPILRCASTDDVRCMWLWLIEGGDLDGWALTSLGLPIMAQAYGGCGVE